MITFVVVACIRGRRRRRSDTSNKRLIFKFMKIQKKNRSMTRQDFVELPSVRAASDTAQCRAPTNQAQAQRDDAKSSTSTTMMTVMMMMICLRERHALLRSRRIPLCRIAIRDLLMNKFDEEKAVKSVHVMKKWENLCYCCRRRWCAMHFRNRPIERETKQNINIIKSTTIIWFWVWARDTHTNQQHMSVVLN